MNNEKIRTVFLYKTYFSDFYNNQSQKVKRQNNLDIQNH